MGLRVLRVIRSMHPLCGGPSAYVDQVTQEMIRQGHRVAVASADGSRADWLDTYDFPVLPLGGKLKRRTSYGISPQLPHWLRGVAPQADILVIDGLWQYHAGAAHRACRATGLPYVVWAHGMLDPWFKEQHPLKHLKKIPHYLCFERRILRDAGRVLFTDIEERIRSRQSFHPYRCREAVCPLGTAAPPTDAAAQRRAALERFPQLAGRRLFVFLGRLHPIKAPDLLVDAFLQRAAAHPDWQLVMVGPPVAGYQQQLEAQVAASGLKERVTWTGMVTGPCKWGLLRLAEAFILPSHHENFGMAVVEALGCGTPALISDKIHIWREIAAAGAGLVDSDDAGGVGRLFDRWAALTPAARAAMGERATTCFHQRFRIDQATRSFTDILQQVLAETKERRRAG